LKLNVIPLSWWCLTLLLPHLAFDSLCLGLELAIQPHRQKPDDEKRHYPEHHRRELRHLIPSTSRSRRLSVAPLIVAEAGP
jgi:hypothetical protein